MRRGRHRLSPALLISLVALFVALGGSVYAAGKISGNAIRVKSLPGNRLRLGSVPGNRLKRGAVGVAQLQPNSVGGAQIHEAALGQVPSAVHADSADSATDALTALNAVNAINASKVNGHEAGCLPGTQPFAGGCWQNAASTAATAPNAAAACASQGGELPGALELAAFAQLGGVNLDGGAEWSSDILSYSVGPYGVATVSPGAVIGSGTVNPAGVSETKKYRCVIPLLK